MMVRSEDLYLEYECNAAQIEACIEWFKAFIIPVNVFEVWNLGDTKMYRFVFGTSLDLIRF
jgi:hypothetical protein